MFCEQLMTKSKLKLFTMITVTIMSVAMGDKKVKLEMFLICLVLDALYIVPLLM